jgi:hypothetical protein
MIRVSIVFGAGVGRRLRRRGDGPILDKINHRNNNQKERAYRILKQEIPVLENRASKLDSTVERHGRTLTAKAYSSRRRKARAIALN